MRQENLDQGTEVSYRVRNRIQEICRGREETFDSGHIFAYKLGGRGDILENVVLMLLSLNRGSYRILEMNIYNTLRENTSWYAQLSVVVRRRMGEEIPYEFTYFGFYYDENGDEQISFVFTYLNSNDTSE